MSIVLIDLSIIFRKHWHASANEPVSEAFNRAVADVHKFAELGEHVAVCIDTPPYLRAELYPEYKAQREKAPTQMFGQLDAVKKRLADDGFLVVGAKGYEADDIIATFVAAYRAEHDITIITGDKDALQLVGGLVRVISPSTGTVMDAEAVIAKFGVPPSRMRELLAIMGDDSDNIPGVKGVGQKTAASWLKDHESLDALFMDLDRLMPERLRAPLREAQDVVRTAHVLVGLRPDAPIDVAEIFEKREIKPLVKVTDDAPSDEQEEDTPPPSEPLAEAQVVAVDEAATKTMAMAKPGGSGAMAHGTWDTALEPRNIEQAMWLSKVLFNGRIFGEFPNAEAVLGTIMTGRTYGLDAVTSLRSFHNIKGKQTMSATLMLGLIKRRTDICEYFQLIESTDDVATFETKRKGEPHPTRLSYTIQEAQHAGLLRPNSQWTMRPKTMLRHRCVMELGRLVYPDVVAGVYSTDEMEDAR